MVSIGTGKAPPDKQIHYFRYIFRDVFVLGVLTYRYCRGETADGGFAAYWLRTHHSLNSYVAYNLSLLHRFSCLFSTVLETCEKPHEEGAEKR